VPAAAEGGEPRPGTAPGRAAGRSTRALAAGRPGRLWRQATGPGWGPLPELLLALTLVTGLVDAVSILALGRVFVANMTGNVVFAGFALVGAPGFSLSSSLFALAGFLIGAALGGVLTSRVGGDRAVHLRAATAAELALVAVSLVIAAASGTPFSALIADALALLLAMAMGIQNSAARKLAVPDLTTTVLTMTLTGIGADPRSGQRGHVTLARRVLVVATMLAGGALGAWLVLHVSAVAALAVAAGLLLLTAAGAAWSARHPADWRAVLAPDVLGGLDDEPQLGRLVGVGKRVAQLSGREAALAGQAQLVQRHVLGGLVDPALEVVLGL
jgi:uncharacterized membrane protein YoaK (UPF0700 family)